MIVPGGTELPPEGIHWSVITEVVIKGRVLALNHNYNQINIFQIIMRKPAFYNE